MALFEQAGLGELCVINKTVLKDTSPFLFFFKTLANQQVPLIKRILLFRKSLSGSFLEFLICLPTLKSCG